MHPKAVSKGAAQEARRGVSTAIVVSAAPVRGGGLGTAIAEFLDGASALGVDVGEVAPQPTGPIGAAATSRPLRRLFGMDPSRRMAARAVRRAVPRGGWDLAYATPGSVPVDMDGIAVIYQATHLPAIEFERLRRAERETGGRGDLSRAELRRREYEVERADLIHVTSLTVRNQFLESGFLPERIVHAYPGVDLERFRPCDKDRSLRIAFVGPLSLRKGVDTVAEISRELKGDVVVEAIGGPTCPWSRRICERAAFVAGRSVPRALGRANVLLLPSRSDGFSYVVLEALASGTVPLVTPEVGAAEIVRRLDPNLVIDRAEFVDAALNLLPRLDLGSLSVRARSLAEGFDRELTSRAIARAVLERVETQELSARVVG